MTQFKIPVDLIMSKLAEASEQAQARARKGSEVLLEDLDTRIRATPYEVVYQEDRVKLKHYRPRKEIAYLTPLLVVYALINRETMLDLQPRRSVVETLLSQGVEVFMIDWGYPTRKDQFQTIGDHVNGYIANIVDFICVKKNIARINIMGICMGGVFSIIYSALYPHKVLNLITTVTPTNFDTDKGLLNIWMKQTDAQVLEMALMLKELSVDAVPVNFLVPISGTPLERLLRISPLRCLKIIALFRYVLPTVEIIICGGREDNLKDLHPLVFFAGASGIMTGNYLTVSGQVPTEDLDMIAALGLEIEATKVG